MAKPFRAQLRSEFDSDGRPRWATVRRINGSDTPFGVLALWSKKPMGFGTFETLVFTGHVIETDAGEVKELELVRSDR